MRVTLEAGDDRCLLDTEHGGRLVSLVAGGRERLIGDEEAAEGPVAWGSFLMAPWVGRLDHGRLPWRGELFVLPADYGPHAIHGTVKDLPWEVEYADSRTARLACPLDDPWPFRGLVRQVMTLRPGGLELVAEISTDGRAMPASLGWHPWFARPGTGDLAVRLAATGTLVSRDDQVPTGEIRALDAVTDLRHGPKLGDRRLDHVHIGVGSSAEVLWPDLALTMQWEPPVNSVTVHTPRRGVCVEPQTAWPDAPNLAADGRQATGLVVVEPGRPLVASTAWTWSARSAA